MLRLLIGVLVSATVFSACSRTEYDPAHDYFSFANSNQFVTRHLELDLKVDFDRQVLAGYAILHMKRLDPGARPSCWTAASDQRCPVSAGGMEAEPRHF